MDSFVELKRGGGVSSYLAATRRGKFYLKEERHFYG
jgi:hypothetical protein